MDNKTADKTEILHVIFTISLFFYPQEITSTLNVVFTVVSICLYNSKHIHKQYVTLFLNIFKN